MSAVTKNLLCILIFVISVISAQEKNKPASQFFIIDGHTHDLVPRNGEFPMQSEMGRLIKAKTGGVILSFPLNSVEPENVVTQIRSDMKYVREYASERNIKMEFVKYFDKSKNEQGILQILSSVEYFGEILSNLDELSDLGIRSIVLSNGNNEISSDGKYLNAHGKSIIKKMNDVNIVIDISHLDEELQLEVIGNSSKPVIASHSNCRGLVRVNRNLTDSVMKKMCGVGGIVMLTFNKEYLLKDENESGTSALLRHINYITKLCGPGHIGLGSDFGGAGRNAPTDLSSIESFNKITDYFLSAGLDKEETAGIMGNNIARFFSNTGN